MNTRQLIEKLKEIDPSGQMTVISRQNIQAPNPRNSLAYKWQGNGMVTFMKPHFAISKQIDVISI
jgi:hypothetical protein